MDSLQKFAEVKLVFLGSEMPKMALSHLFFKFVLLGPKCAKDFKIFWTLKANIFCNSYPVRKIETGPLLASLNPKNQKAFFRNFFSMGTERGIFDSGIFS